ncbi:MAG: hypothetical protein QXT19_00055 [Candidatus Woesearchaeota archaeon]
MPLDKKTWMSIFISAIMILSVIGFALTFTEPEHQVEYNGIKFSKTQQGWQAKIKGVKMQFFYHPAEVEDIPFDKGAGVALDGPRVVWFSYNPNDLYSAEIADVMYYMEDSLGKWANVYVQRALTDNADYQLPQITCANATMEVPVIIIESGNETVVEHRDGCIIASADNARDIYRLGDRLIYQELKVMK